MKILIGLQHEGTIYSEVGEFLFQVQAPEGYNRFLLTTNGKSAFKRNQLVELALERKDVEWFFLLDDQQVLNAYSLKYLINEAEKENVKIVTPITFSYRFKFPIPILHDIQEEIRFESMISTGIYEMKAVSTQCILIKREVFESIDPPWFSDLPEGAILDRDFSKKCREAGFDLFINEDVIADRAEVIDLKDYNSILELAISNKPEEITEELYDLLWSENSEADIL